LGRSLTVNSGFSFNPQQPAQGHQVTFDHYLKVSEDDIVKGLDAASARFGIEAEPVKDRPVFVLSAGWRSGSTALQRLLTSPQTRIWGEPYNLSGIIQALARQWAPFSSDWPDERHVRAAGETEPVSPARWIANLYPEPVDLLEGQRQLLLRTFADPALRDGCSSWGLKEVRLGGGTAAFLKSLFQRAEFIFLVRNPYDAYRSYVQMMQSRGSLGWYLSWPQHRVATAVEFGQVWRQIAESFVSYEYRTSALIVRYEDLGSPATLDQIASHVSVPVDRSTLSHSVGSSFSSDVVSAKAVLETSDVLALAGEVGVIAEGFGYHGPTGKKR